MSADQEQDWSGWGRWLSFVLAALLIFLSIPLVVLNAASAGWNIFLALLLFAAVASGHKKAPQIAMVVAVLMAVRLVGALAARADVLDITIAVFLLALASAGAYDLRRQARSV
jgi:asparagine N-glycosylation enzyme membrane subunit Stt3